MGTEKVQKSKQFMAYINMIIDDVEKGFSNHKEDTGGATMWGITERLARAHGYKGTMRDLPRDTAIDIYHAEFWVDKVSPHILNNVAFHLFDCSINSGYNQAVKLLQRAVGVAEDGAMGANTINAISKYSETVLILRFNICRMAFYGSLKNFGTFGNGWRNRLLILSEIKWGDHYA